MRSGPVAMPTSRNPSIRARWRLRSQVYWPTERTGRREHNYSRTFEEVSPLTRCSLRLLILPILLLELACHLPAQERDLFREFRWRMIGPYRGGRTVGVAGIPGQPNVFYIGVNNGGVWRTDDYGQTWTPLFDDQPTGSIGAIAIAPSDPSILYVGSGEGL